MKRILLIVTRDINTDREFGRPKILTSIIATASSNKAAVVFHARSLLERKAYFSLAIAIFRRMVTQRKNGRWPLQCILFDDRDTWKRLEKIVARERPSVIYFDTVRCFTFIQRVAEKYPEIKLICDFDDLMSRRMQMVKALSEKLTMGYVDRWAMAGVKRVMENRWVSNTILEYEAQTLFRVEARVHDLVDGVVMLSSADAEVFRTNLGVRNRDNVDAIPPPFVAQRPVRVELDGLRFVFIGSDRLLQNRLSIDRLLDIWKRHSIPYPLYIYGRQTREQMKTPNVFFAGFAGELEEVYTRSSILIAPAAIGGGIKTKMLEALAFGNISLGNKTSFEGIEGGDEVAMTEEELVDTLANLPDRIGVLIGAAQRLQDHLSNNYGAVAFRSRWMRLLDVDNAL
jgi:Glycosyl transferases group 1